MGESPPRCWRCSGWIQGQSQNGEVLIYDDNGITVLLTGGCRTHIGCVTAAEPGGLLRTMDFPGHREKAIAEEWAETLAKQSGRRVCVVCGIHYDDLDRPGLDEVLYTLKKMLSEAQECLK